VTELSEDDGLDYFEWWRRRIVEDDALAKTANRDIGHLSRMLKDVSVRRRLKILEMRLAAAHAQQFDTPTLSLQSVESRLSRWVRRNPPARCSGVRLARELLFGGVAPAANGERRNAGFCPRIIAGGAKHSTRAW
jgi:hypothetical protein